MALPPLGSQFCFLPGLLRKGGCSSGHISGTRQLFHLRLDKGSNGGLRELPFEQAQSLPDHFLCQLHASHMTADLHRKRQTSQYGLVAQETAGTCQRLEMPGISPATGEGIQLCPPGDPSGPPCLFTSPLRLKKMASSKRAIPFAFFSTEFLRTSASFSFMRAFAQAHRELVSMGAEPKASLVLPVASGICLKRACFCPWWCPPKHSHTGSEHRHQ